MKRIACSQLPKLEAAQIECAGDSAYFRRLKALIELARGAAPKDIARSTGISIRSLQRWARRFRQRGSDGLKTRPPRGRRPKLNARQSERIRTALALPPSHFGYDQEKWTGALLSQHLRERFRTVLGVRQCRNLIRHHQPESGGVTQHAAALPPSLGCTRWAFSDYERKRLALERIRKLATAGAALGDFVSALFDIVSEAIPDGEPKTLWLGPSLETGWIYRNLDFASWWPGAKRFIFDSEAAVSGMRGPRELFRMPGNVLRPEQLMLPNFRRGPAYNEVVRPLGLDSCAMMLLRDGAEMLGLYPLHKSASQAPFGDDDFRFLDAAAPHVVHGIKAAQMLTKVRHSSSSTDQPAVDCPGVILVSRSGRVMSVSAQARSLFLELGAFDGVEQDAFISGPTREATDYIAAILRDIFFREGSAPGEAPVARLYNHRSGFALRLRGIATESDDGCFTILVERVVSPQSECQRLRFRYALNEREATVLMMLGKRMSDKEVAAQLSISPSTVRQYLRQLASKLAVSGQSGVRSFAQLAKAT
jgi:transposase